LVGRTPHEAAAGYADQVRAALHCVTQVRLTLRRPATAAPRNPCALALNDLNPVALRGPFRLRLTVGEVVRVGAASEIPGGDYRVDLVAYFYQLQTRDDRELFGFHWTPEAGGPAVVTFPHLHVGRVLLAGQTVLRPDDLH
jgi:hypothetical protein